MPRIYEGCEYGAGGVQFGNIGTVCIRQRDVFYMSFLQSHKVSRIAFFTSDAYSYNVFFFSFWACSSCTVVDSVTTIYRIPYL